MLEHWLSTHTPVGEHTEVDDTARSAIDVDAVHRVLDVRDGRCRVALEGQPAATAVIAVEVATSGSPDSLLDLRWWPVDDPQQFSHFTGAVRLLRRTGRSLDLGIMGRYRLDRGLREPRRIMTSTSMLARRLVRGLAREMRAHRSDAAAVDAVVRPLRVSDVMSTGPLVMRHDVDLQTAALLLLHHRYSAAPVVDDRGELVGVVSTTDLFPLGADAGARGATVDPWQPPHVVADVMNRPAITTGSRTPLRDAAVVLRERDIGRLIVTDDDTIVGVVSRQDVLKALAHTAEVVQHAVDECLDRPATAGISGRVHPDGTVLLRGTAGSPAEVEAARAAVRTIEGVTATTSLVNIDGAARSGGAE